MNENKIAIIGFGMVGKSSSVVLSIPEQDCYNSQNKNQLLEKIKDGIYDTFIICLPTPTINSQQDLSAIREWLELLRSNDYLVIIRSTILPGTTKKLSEEYGLNLVHVPEFLTEATAIEDELNPEFLVIGADDILVREKVRRLFLRNESQINNKKVIECNSQTAEMIKYSLNSWFALKVIMANQLWDVSKEVGADYEKVKMVLTKHKWGSKNGWDVWHKGFRGFGGNCLPKDVQAFTQAFDLPLLEKMVEINERLVKETK